MKKSQKLPIGIQNFESLRRDGYLYVDKTECIYRLVSDGRYYFLSRPRRFGKSLLMSTIQALYEGKKELFDGTIGKRLFIADQEDIDWEAHPVLHLDLNTQKYDRVEALTNVLNENLVEWERLYGRNEAEVDPGRRFAGVIKRACEKTGKRTVILVDEYDKPMLQALENEPLLNEYRATLKGFYGSLKSMDGYIQFALLTGVTKFSKVSVFSDLNNLSDISMDKQYYNVCGITEDELLTVGLDSIEHTAIYNCCGGYTFGLNIQELYNTGIALNYLWSGHLSTTFSQFTPTFLYNMFREFPIESLRQLFNNDTPFALHLQALMDSGFVKSVNGRYDFTNKETCELFFHCLLHAPYIQNLIIKDYVVSLCSGNTDAFIKRLRSLFADTPYELVKDLENHYQNVLWILYKLMGFYTQAEYHTSEGRIDLVIKTPKFCYVMEFKLDGTAEEAMEQIKDKSYALPFEVEDQQIIRIGMNFSNQTRNIEKYIVE